MTQECQPIIKLNPQLNTLQQLGVGKVCVLDHLSRQPGLPVPTRGMNTSCISPKTGFDEGFGWPVYSPEEIREVQQRPGFLGEIRLAPMDETL